METVTTQFLQRTDVSVDLNQVLEDLNSILSIYPWPTGNQIGLKHRPTATDVWLDAHGSLNKSGAKESEFTEWNPNCPVYLKTVIEQLEARYNFKSNRVRLMKLPPKKGLTVHYDTERRYHLVLKTSPFAYMFEVNTETNTPLGTHMPADGYFYLVDTRKVHFVYNGSAEDRIHLVINESPIM